MGVPKVIINKILYIVLEVAFDQLSYFVDEGSSNLSVCLNLNTSLDRSVQLSLKAQPITAQSMPILQLYLHTIYRHFFHLGDVDFRGFSESLELNATTPNLSCYQIAIIDDDILENTEEFLLELSSDDSAVFIPTPNVTASILDNDGNQGENNN